MLLSQIIFYQGAATGGAECCCCGEGCCCNAVSDVAGVVYADAACILTCAAGAGDVSSDAVDAVVLSAVNALVVSSLH